MKQCAQALQVPSTTPGVVLQWSPKNRHLRAVQCLSGLGTWSFTAFQQRGTACSRCSPWKLQLKVMSRSRTRCRTHPPALRGCRQAQQQAGSNLEIRQPGIFLVSFALTYPCNQFIAVGCYYFLVKLLLSASCTQSLPPPLP